MRAEFNSLLGVAMKPPGPIIALFTTWGSVLLAYAGYVAYYKLTTTEPDMKFGDSAPYIALALLGGLGGFLAGLAALVATFAFEERYKVSVPPARLLKVGVVAAAPFSVAAWCTAVWSPLPVLGTLVAWFSVCAVVFWGLLYAGHAQSSNA